jgi:AraC-like DNA-binding protein
MRGVDAEERRRIIDRVMHKLHDRSSGSHVAASGVARRAAPRPASRAGRPAPGAGARTDVLSDVLGSLRLSGSMFFLVDAAEPWATRAPRAAEFAPSVLPGARHLVSYHVVTQGDCWAGIEGGVPQRLEAGDIFVVPHGDAYFLAGPGPVPPSPDGPGTLAFFREMAAGRLRPVVAAGGDGPVQARFICGFLGCDALAFDPLLGALPPMIHLRRAAAANDRMGPLVEFALRELRERRQGGQGVLLRLSELMFIEVVRCVVESGDSPRTGWMAGLRDPVAGRALALLHAAPADAWTLGLLASKTGVSRSVLAERFARAVGQPPMRYLSRWRMQLAARRLADGTASVKRVAASVGYESEAAFSRAFSRHTGVAPASWRRHVRSSEDTTEAG